jgi:methylated-DNA-protein-cysteine methyltransferase-like protein
MTPAGVRVTLKTMAGATRQRSGDLFLHGGAKRPGRPRQAPDPALQLIWDVVSIIPHGGASTYGSVARAAGLPGRARLVGFALKTAPPALQLPWHRVVGAGGRIVFPKTSRAHREQARRLRAEGVRVANGRVAPTALVAMDQT